MKYFSLFILMMAFVCCASAQSQMQENENAQKNFLKAEKDLNNVYKKILTEYKADTAFTKNLKTAQRLWFKLRDAEMLAKYPDREPSHYGNSFSMCWLMYKEELTIERIKKLKTWLTGIKEGDLCTGSVKIK